MEGKTYLLHIENFMSIQTMDLELKGVKGITGKNEQGKTTVLRALESLLSGANSDSQLIRDGEKRSLIRLDEVFQGEVIKSVSKVQTPGGARIEAKDLGTDTPMSYLGRILDKVAVNPVQLIGKDPVTYLKNHLNASFREGDVDKNSIPVSVREFTEGKAFRDCDNIAAAIGQERVIKGRELKHAIELCDELAKNLPTMTPMPEVNSTVILQRDAEISEAKARIQIERENADKLKEVRENAELEVAVIENGIKNYEDKITLSEQEEPQIDAAMKESLHQLELFMQKRKAEIEAEAQKKKADAASLRESARVIINEKKISLQKAKETVEELKTREVYIDTEGDRLLDEKRAALSRDKATWESWLYLKSKHDQLAEKVNIRNKADEEYKALDLQYKYFAYELPKILLSRCNLPIPGLAFRDNDLYIDESETVSRRIDQLSTAQRALIAIKLGIALAKAKGHIAVTFDGIEYLDEEHRAEFLRIAHESGISVLYTRHGSPEYPFEYEIKKGAPRVQQTIV